MGLQSCALYLLEPILLTIPFVSYYFKRVHGIHKVTFILLQNSLLSKNEECNVSTDTHVAEEIASLLSVSTTAYLHVQ